MKTIGYLRGHEITCIDDKCFYTDNGEPTASTYKDRPCKKCNKVYTKEGHDACLGTLKGVLNACCGHGVTDHAYVQLLDGFSIHGKDAVTIQDILKHC